VVSTPATAVRSLIGTGSPASKPRLPTGRFINSLACVRARSKQSVGSALNLAIDLGDPRFQRVEQIERGYLTGIEFFDDGASRCVYQTLVSHLISPVHSVS